MDDKEVVCGKTDKRQLVNEAAEFRNVKRCIQDRMYQAETSNCMQSVPSLASLTSESRESNITILHIYIGSSGRRTMPWPAPSRYVPKNPKQSDFMVSGIGQANPA